MKQKYIVLLDKDTSKLAIQEYAELDKEILSLLCEESYDTDTIKAAMEKDRNSLIQALRTHNMYPPGIYTERIADTVTEMFQPGGGSSAELLFEEREIFENEEEETIDDTDDVEKDDNSSIDVDDLLEDEIDDGFEEKGIIDDLNKKNTVSDSKIDTNDN